MLFIFGIGITSKIQAQSFIVHNGDPNCGVTFTIDYIELDCITPNSQVVYVAPVSNVDLSTILSRGICGITGADISISGGGSTGALTNNASPVNISDCLAHICTANWGGNDVWLNY